MPSPDAIVIQLSRTKVALLTLGAFAFVIAGAWVFFNAHEIPRFSPLKVQVAGIAGAAFFGLCGVYGLIKMFDNRPGLVIDAEGILDQSGGLAAGMIPWADITGLATVTIQRQRMLVIHVADPAVYIARGNAFQRRLKSINAGLVGSPVTISANALKVGFDDLLKLITEAHARHAPAAPHVADP